MSEPRNPGPATRLLFLHAQTALHPGSGTALGVVDLPVQRERHTQWPIIPGSSLKGVLRDACRERAKAKPDHAGDRRKANNDADLVAAFGPDTQEADKHAGAVSVTDARLLAFPVRSLKGVFAWVTCPAVLERLNRDLALAGQPPIEDVPDWGHDDRDVAACREKSPLLVNDDKLILEEFEFTRMKDKNAEKVSVWMAEHAVGADTRERLKKHLAVLTDDDFTHFVRHATEVVARVGLDYDRKTVRPGALFYQEFLPTETLFYSVIIANQSRRPDDGRNHRHDGSAASIMGYLAEHLESGKVLQIGGDETTGKGLCRVQFSTGKETA